MEEVREPMQSAIPAIASIRRFVRQRTQVERCELCGKDLAPQHEHLLELANRNIRCACGACAMLFDSSAADTRFRRIPHRIIRLSDFQMTDATWEALHLPINLAFFYHSSPLKRMIAMFPSPAGATESQLPIDAWSQLCSANPLLNEMQSDVESLLVNCIGQQHEYWLVPIDECFKLVGLIRTHWRGLSGGTEVWREIQSFYQSLRDRATGGVNA